MAYSYLIDEGRWDDWFALFSDDVVFENTSPELGTLILKGMKAFKELVQPRSRRGRVSSRESMRFGREPSMLLAAPSRSMARSSGTRMATSGPVCSRVR